MRRIRVRFFVLSARSGAGAGLAALTCHVSTSLSARLTPGVSGSPDCVGTPAENAHESRSEQRPPPDRRDRIAEVGLLTLSDGHGLVIAGCCPVEIAVQ